MRSRKQCKAIKDLLGEGGDYSELSQLDSYLQDLDSLEDLNSLIYCPDSATDNGLYPTGDLW